MTDNDEHAKDVSPDQEGDAPESAETTREEAEAIETETREIMRAGPISHNRAGGFAFLGLVVVIGAALYFYLSSDGGDAFLARLDTDLVSHAELALASEKGGRLTVVPAWPLQLYETLRNDIMLYAGAAVLASLLWGGAARARARRDAWLVHEKLSREVAELRRRLDSLDTAGSTKEKKDERKGT